MPNHIQRGPAGTSETESDLEEIHMKRFAIALGALVALLFASPASATTVCPEWTMRSIVTEWGTAAPGSMVVDADEVELTKPAGGGTEFKADNLDLSGTITVDYELSDDASFTAGAVRLFVYADQDADTFNDAPDAFVAADAKSGTLTIPATEVGTVGMVYDASNGAPGVVTFSNLKIGGVALSFTACASPSPSASATPTAPATTAPPSDGPTGTSAPPAADGPTLPVTGSDAGLIAGIGGSVLLAGVVGVFIARRRRTRFTA